jgi:hypothetical protein
MGKQAGRLTRHSVTATKIVLHGAIHKSKNFIGSLQTVVRDGLSHP